MMMCFFRFFDRKNDIVHKYEAITLCISTNRNFIFRKYVLTAEFLYSLLTFFTLKCIIFTKDKTFISAIFYYFERRIYYGNNKENNCKNSPCKNCSR